MASHNSHSDSHPNAQAHQAGGAFECSKCGACCSHLEAFGELYADLDNGHGVCRYYDAKTHLCTCYEQRPLKCRVDEGYEHFFKSQLSYEEYLKLLCAGCRYLQQLPDKFPAS